MNIKKLVALLVAFFAVHVYRKAVADINRSTENIRNIRKSVVALNTQQYSFEEFIASVEEAVRVAEHIAEVDVARSDKRVERCTSCNSWDFVVDMDHGVCIPCNSYIAWIANNN